MMMMTMTMIMILTMSMMINDVSDDANDHNEDNDDDNEENSIFSEVLIRNLWTWDPRAWDPGQECIAIITLFNLLWFCCLRNRREAPANCRGLSWSS